MENYKEQGQQQGATLADKAIEMAVAKGTQSANGTGWLKTQILIYEACSRDVDAYRKVMKARGYKEKTIDQYILTVRRNVDNPKVVSGLPTRAAKKGKASQWGGKEEKKSKFMSKISIAKRGRRAYSISWRMFGKHISELNDEEHYKYGHFMNTVGKRKKRAIIDGTLKLKDVLGKMATKQAQPAKNESITTGFKWSKPERKALIIKLWQDEKITEEDVKVLLG